MARGETQMLQPFSRASEADRARWAGLIRVFANEMYLVDGPPDLSQFADLLYGLSHGRIGNLRRILSRALFDLIDGSRPGEREVLTEAMLCGAAAASGVAVQKPKVSTPGRKKDAVAG